MYSKPEVSRYTGLELLDLMGPVETSYDCELRAPDTIECGTDVNIFVDISEVPDFKKALFTWEPPGAGSSGLAMNRSRTEDIKDGWWTQQFSLGCANYIGPGWTVAVTLMNGDEATCSDEFTLTIE